MTGVQTCDHPDRKSTRLNSSHTIISYAVFCLKKHNHYRDPGELETPSSPPTHPPPAAGAHGSRAAGGSRAWRLSCVGAAGSPVFFEDYGTPRDLPSSPPRPLSV